MTAPLEGLRVLETGTLIAGPFCGQLLADFGADVIKLEDPAGGDPMRGWGRAGPGGGSLTWPIIARNKRSVTCNLRTPAGAALARRLAADSDVLVENFRPGTLERWGLGYPELSAVNPRLVLVRVTAYGQTGPYAGRAGFGSIGEAMGGIRYLTGDADRPPSRAGISLGDALAGTFAALGTLLAVHARERTGRGQIVDAAIYEAVLALMEALLPEWEIGGHQRERSGAILPGVAPSNVYPTADGPDILIAANRDTVFSRLAAVMADAGAPEVGGDPRFATHSRRGEHQAELDALIAVWSATQPVESLLERLHTAGVPAGKIYRAADMLTDPHFAAREAIVRLAHPLFGDMPVQNVAPKLSDTPGAVRRPGPELGEHNDAVYRGLLGMSDDELAALRAAGDI